MKLTRLILILPLCLLVILPNGCKLFKKAPVADVEEQIEGNNGDEDSCLSITIVKDLYNRPTDPFKIRSMRIENACLLIDVEYGGGCKEVTFDLLWDGAVMESAPPQVRFYLTLDDDDRCKALKKTTRSYDISKIRETVPKGGVIINLKDYSETILFE